MTTELSKYNAAKQALAEARTFDEVKDIRDKAMAMRLYAQQAKDKSLEKDALEIRIRAEARLGEMMEAQRQQDKLSRGGRPIETGFRENPVSIPSLASQGINKNLADRARTLAKMTPEKREDYIKEARENLTLAQRPRRNDPFDTEKLPQIEVIAVEFSMIEDNIFSYSQADLQRLLQKCKKMIEVINKHSTDDKVTRISKG